MVCVNPLAPPVTPPVTPGTVHEYVVPGGTVPFTPSVGEILNGLPVHAMVVNEVMEGIGKTVNVRVKGFPEPQAVLGVTV